MNLDVILAIGTLCTLLFGIIKISTMHPVLTSILSPESPGTFSKWAFGRLFSKCLFAIIGIGVLYAQGFPPSRNLEIKCIDDFFVIAT